MSCQLFEAKNRDDLIPSVFYFLTIIFFIEGIVWRKDWKNSMTFKAQIFMTYLGILMLGLLIWRLEVHIKNVIAVI